MLITHIFIQTHNFFHLLHTNLQKTLPFIYFIVQVTHWKFPDTILYSDIYNSLTRKYIILHSKGERKLKNTPVLNEVPHLEDILC